MVKKTNTTKLLLSYKIDNNLAEEEKWKNVDINETFGNFVALKRSKASPKRRKVTKRCFIYVQVGITQSTINKMIK